MMSERGLQVAHTTILRWVRRYAPEFIKRWNRFARSTGRSWRVDETYIKVCGEWTYLSYLYRAVDKAGQTVDFRLCRRRNVAAAKAFFVKAIRHEGRSPHMITLDGYVAPSSTRDARGRTAIQAHEAAIFQVSQQPDRTGPLAPEIARSDKRTRALTSDQVKADLELIVGLLPGKDKRAARSRAILTFSALVGAMSLARAVSDEALSREIVKTVADLLKHPA
jgi:DDE domain